jgi:hypothetical protein
MLSVKSNNLLIPLVWGIAASAFFGGCAKTPQYLVVDEELGNFEKMLVKDGFEPITTHELLLSSDGNRSSVFSQQNFGEMHVDLPVGTSVFFKKRLTDERKIVKNMHLHTQTTGLHGGNAMSGQHVFGMQEKDGIAWSQQQRALSENGIDKKINDLKNAESGLKQIGKSDENEFDKFYSECSQKNGVFDWGKIEKGCINFADGKRSCGTEGYRASCELPGEKEKYFLEMRTHFVKYKTTEFVRGMVQDHVQTVISKGPAYKDTIRRTQGAKFENYEYFVFYKR